jgi:predicted secreted acid phosphatase
MKYRNFYSYITSQLENLLEFDFSPNKAIIFDIDGTLINVDEENWRDHIPIPPIYHFYKYCMNKGLNIFIVTARSGHEENMHYTGDKMVNHLNLDFEKIFFRPPNISDISDFKQNCRNHIKSQGFNVVMSIGDNIWDIGPNGGLGFLIKDFPFSQTIVFDEYFY